MEGIVITNSNSDVSDKTRQQLLTLILTELIETKALEKPFHYTNPTHIAYPAKIDYNESMPNHIVTYGSTKPGFRWEIIFTDEKLQVSIIHPNDDTYTLYPSWDYLDKLDSDGSIRIALSNFEQRVLEHYKTISK